MATTVNSYIAEAEQLAVASRRGDPEWLNAARQRALAAFDRLGFPTTRDEEWRFTSVAPIADASFSISPDGAPGLTRADIDAYRWITESSVTLVFVNGRYRADLSDTIGVPPSVRIGSLAAATSDTWATEIGTLAGRPPRSIVSLKALAPGTSGGVTLPGLLASLAGAVFIALAAYATGAVNDAGAIVTGGVAGSLAASLVGATVQERRWCDDCSQSTERRVHSCGRGTRIFGGVPGARNDFVNVVCTIVGGIVAVLFAR